ncbi:MAG: tryptophan synthase subunit alpha [Chloroflexi bacterium]|nr:tryptophan synthase subunit alpha [Chloroflexota bacterium]
MTRFTSTFERLRADGVCGLFPYLTAGYPDRATSRDLALAALEAGADGFEIGVPFSDPLADGATLQRANARALEGGATLDTALELAQYIRARAPDAPLALMTYSNPLLRRGETGFARALAAAGADGAIVPDLPGEESASLGAALAAEGMDLVQMLAPTSPDIRLARVGALARGFVYCVALVGVTGARDQVAGDLGPFLARVRAVTSTPLVVGFGISRPEHVHAVAAAGADGVIVASALVDLLERSGNDLQAARIYLTEMKAATTRAVLA